ncbi:hypothetical protein VTI74DRAFT_1735 [Chaetomium olivicolor]
MRRESRCLRHLGRKGDGSHADEDGCVRHPQESTCLLRVPSWWLSGAAPANELDGYVPVCLSWGALAAPSQTASTADKNERKVAWCSLHLTLSQAPGFRGLNQRTIRVFNVGIPLRWRPRPCVSWLRVHETFVIGLLATSAEPATVPTLLIPAVWYEAFHTRLRIPSTRVRLEREPGISLTIYRVP